MEDLLSLLSQPNSQSAALRATRRAEEAAALKSANEQAGSLDMLAVAGQMANNPGAAAATKMAAGQQRQRFAPQALGQSGFMLPNEGQFVESPMFADEKQAGRESRLQLAVAAMQEKRVREQDRRDLTLQRDEDRRTDSQRARDQAEAFRRDMAGQTNALRRDALAAREAAANAAPKGRGLPMSAINKLSTQEGAAVTFADLISSFRDELAGTFATAAFENTMGKYQPLGVGKKFAAQSNWWQNYNTQKNILRNELFGSALTKTEKEAFDAANITEGMEPGQIRNKLAQQHRAVVRARNILLANAGRGNFDISGFTAMLEPEALDPGNTARGTIKPPPAAPAGRSPAPAPARRAAPTGVPQASWDAMTESDRALFK